MADGDVLKIVAGHQAFAPGDDLEDVLAAGNDTGGSPLISDTSASSGTADVSITATAAGVDTAQAFQEAYSESGSAFVYGNALAQDGGPADASQTSRSIGGGDATSATSARANGVGGANASSTALSIDGDANANTTATASGGGHGSAVIAAVGTSAEAGVSASGLYGTASFLVADDGVIGIAVARVNDGASVGTAGQFLTSSNLESGAVQWRSPLVRIAAEVPTGAPSYAELPIAVDSTAVSGGIYVWDGAAWVKAATV